MKEYSVSWKRHRKEPFCAAHHTKRQHQCIQVNNHVAPQHKSAQNHSLQLATFTSQNTSPMLPVFIAILLLATSIPPAFSSGPPLKANQTLKAGAELLKLRRIRTHLKKINKPAVKTIQAFSLICYITSNGETLYFCSCERFGDLGFCHFVAESRW